MCNYYQLPYKDKTFLHFPIHDQQVYHILGMLKVSSVMKLFQQMKMHFYKFPLQTKGALHFLFKTEYDLFRFLCMLHNMQKLSSNEINTKMKISIQQILCL